ncbi:MaoC family dehydratase [Chloroflexota bacterium]
MPEGSAITEEMRRAVGVEKATPIAIEKRMIKRFVEAIEDPNPLWQDEEYAKKTQYGGTIAPPMLFVASMMSGTEVRPDVPNPFQKMLDGGGKWEFFQPVRPGDVITATGKLADLREREGKLGKMVYWMFEITHKNQRGELVSRARSTLITY